MDGHLDDEGSVDHLASIYESQADQFESVVPFIKGGLEQGERCLYVADDNTEEELLEALRESGIDAEAALESGALSIHTEADTYLRTEEISQNAMLEFWQETLAEARDDKSYTGVRAATEMTWALDEDTGRDELVQYEALLNNVLEGDGYVVLCQYNRDRFSGDVLSDVIRSHQLVVYDGTVCQNFYHHPTEKFFDADHSHLDVDRTAEGLVSRARTQHAPDEREEQLHARLRQQEVIADLGHQALDTDDLDQLLQNAAVTVAETLDTDYCGVLELLPDGDEVFLRQGVGWRDGLVGTATAPTDPGSQAGYTLLSDEPVIIEDLRTEERFSGPEHLTSHDVISGISVTIGSVEEPWGVLGTHTTDERMFTEHDVNFVQSVANLLAAAIERQEYQTELEQTVSQLEESERRYRTIAEAFPNGVVTLHGDDLRYTLAAGQALDDLPVTGADLEGCRPQDVFPVDIAEKLESVLEANLDGENQTVELEYADRDWNVHAVPLHDESGEAFTGVTMVQEITDRKERERERQTIIDRVTDAVVEVDEDWYFTLVDDRAEEIYGMDEGSLLGQYFWEVFSGARGTRFEETYRDVMETREPATLEAYNTDLDGWFHVEIYPESNGGLAFYFQDITDRKCHEQRVASLNDILAECLGAASEQQVADIVTEASTEMLDFPVAAIGLYNDQEGTLQPTTQTPAAAELLDISSLFDVGDNVGWDAFVRGETCRVRDPVADTESAVQSAITELVVIPLDNHGAFIVGSTSAEGFDSADVEFAETVAANTTAAFDRTNREEQLQKREATLQEKTETLERLSRVNEIIRSIDQALVQASSRAEIEAVVCEQLAAASPYELAWIGEHDGVAQEVTPTAWAGVENGYLDEITFTAHDDPVGQGPIGRAVKTGETHVVNDILDDVQAESWRQDALNRGYHAIIALPLHYEGSLYGVLNVYASQPDVFDDTEQAVLTELADTIAYAINAVESKKALVSDEVTKLEFAVDDKELEIVDVAREFGCEFTLESLVPRADDGYRVFFSMRGAPPAALTEVASQLPVTDLSLISEYHKGGDTVGLYTASLDDSSLAATVLEHGGRPVEVFVEEGTATVVIELATDAETQEFVEMFRTKYPDSRLTAQRSSQRPQQTPQGTQSAMIEELTARQLEVLQTAYFNGYFEEPRKQSASETAAALDIAQPTFTSHIRAAQRKLYRHLFEEELFQT